MKGIPKSPLNGAAVDNCGSIARNMNRYFFTAALTDRHSSVTMSFDHIVYGGGPFLTALITSEHEIHFL